MIVSLDVWQNVNSYFTGQRDGLRSGVHYLSKLETALTRRYDIQNSENEKTRPCPSYIPLWPAQIHKSQNSENEKTWPCPPSIPLWPAQIHKSQNYENEKTWPCPPSFPLWPDQIHKSSPHPRFFHCKRIVELTSIVTCRWKFSVGWQCYLHINSLFKNCLKLWRGKNILCGLKKRPQWFWAMPPVTLWRKVCYTLKKSM